MDFLKELNPDQWFSYEWFLPKTFLGYTWEFPWLLYTIPFLPLLLVLRWIFLVRFRFKFEFAFPHRKARTFTWVTLFRFIPGVFFLTSLSLFIIAAARPQRMKEVIEQWSQGIDIVLAIDISESMLLRDFQPNRLESAKRVAQQFIKGRVHDRIGIVVFSGVAYPLAPLSTDYDFLCSLLQNVQPGSIDQSGTAIGSALAVACNRLKDIESNSKVIVLLSDGENTAGSIDPMVAAQIAATLNIKVYTIAIGKDGKVPFSEDSTGVIEYVDNVLNEAVLRKISSIGKGTFYRAYDQNLLYQIFENINKLEKSKISENRFRNFEDFYPIYIYWGLVFFLVWLLTKSTFLSNAMED